MRERKDIVSDDEHMAERQKFLNASESGIVCGEASYGSLAELYAEKKGLRPPLVAHLPARPLGARPPCSRRWPKNARPGRCSAPACMCATPSAG